MSKVNIRNRNANKFYKDGTRKPPNWEYRFEGAKVNGKRTQISEAGFRTKKDAEDAGAKALAEYNNAGQVFKPSEMSFADYLDYWIEHYCKINLKDTTVKSYEKKIRLYLKPTFGQYYLKAISASILQDFINKKFNDGFSRNTLVCLKGIISGALDYAVEPCRFIPQNPAVFVKMPNKRAVPDTPTRKKVRRPVTDDEWNQIIERFPEGHPAHIPLILTYRCGFRLSEVFALMWEDVDFENDTIKIDRQIQMDESIKEWSFQAPKYDSYRTVYVDSETMKLLQREHSKQIRAKEYYAEHYKQICIKDDIKSDHLYNNGHLSNLGKPINMIMSREDGTYIQPRIMQHVGRVIHGKNNKSAVAISEDWDTHSLRHTHATQLLEMGVPMQVIQERLGHTDLQITERYTHVTDKMQQELLQKLNSKALT